MSKCYTERSVYYMGMDVFDLAAQAIFRGSDGSQEAARAALVFLSYKREIVCAAYAAGISKRELHVLTGIARTTINSWIASMDTDGEH